MNVVRVPPIQLSPISETNLSWRWLSGQEPVDFSEIVNGSGWSAEFLLIHRREVLFRAPVDLSSDGYLAVTVPSAISEQMRCKKEPSYQITITSPYPDFSEVWTGSVAIYEVSQ